ncbi:hypothetical protein ABZ471_02620 [Streptomyces sp. NPDC005728]|uniref:hypothetical protein n=1 Tax=Streptomyces sp. NPDC005728 TaxID=3157054 RepID=UPI0033F4EA72
MGKSATGALASAAAATVATTVTRQSAPVTGHHAGAPPPHTARAEAPPPYAPPPNAPAPGQPPPPEYSAIPPGAFDPRELTDFQLDELVHRIIGRITRLIRTELRLDRERIGKLRDPRH